MDDVQEMFVDQDLESSAAINPLHEAMLGIAVPVPPMEDTLDYALDYTEITEPVSDDDMGSSSSSRGSSNNSNEIESGGLVRINVNGFKNALVDQEAGLLYKNSVTDPEDVAIIQRLLAKNAGRRVMQCRGLATVGKQSYSVYDYIPGGTLSNFVRINGAAANWGLLADDLLIGLEEVADWAEINDILPGRVCPDSIFVASIDPVELKIGDCLISEGKSSVNGAPYGNFHASIHYIAPELVEVMAEALSGEEASKRVKICPRKAMSYTAAAILQFIDSKNDDAEFPTEIPEEIMTFLQECKSKDPSERPSLADIRAKIADYCKAWIYEEADEAPEEEAEAVTVFSMGKHAECDGNNSEPKFTRWIEGDEAYTAFASAHDAAKSMNELANAANSALIFLNKLMAETDAIRELAEHNSPVVLRWTETETSPLECELVTPVVDYEVKTLKSHTYPHLKISDSVEECDDSVKKLLVLMSGQLNKLGTAVDAGNKTLNKLSSEVGVGGSSKSRRKSKRSNDALVSADESSAKRRRSGSSSDAESTDDERKRVKRQKKKPSSSASDAESSIPKARTADFYEYADKTKYGHLASGFFSPLAMKNLDKLREIEKKGGLYNNSVTDATSEDNRPGLKCCSGIDPITKNSRTYYINGTPNYPPEFYEVPPIPDGKITASQLHAFLSSSDCDKLYVKNLPQGINKILMSSTKKGGSGGEIGAGSKNNANAEIMESFNADAVAFYNVTTEGGRAELNATLNAMNPLSPKDRMFLMTVFANRCYVCGNLGVPTCEIPTNVPNSNIAVCKSCVDVATAINVKKHRLGKKNTATLSRGLPVHSERAELDLLKGEVPLMYRLYRQWYRCALDEVSSAMLSKRRHLIMETKKKDQTAVQGDPSNYYSNDCGYSDNSPYQVVFGKPKETEDSRGILPKGATNASARLYAGYKTLGSVKMHSALFNASKVTYSSSHFKPSPGKKGDGENGMTLIADSDYLITAFTVEQRRSEDSS